MVALVFVVLAIGAGVAGRSPDAARDKPTSLTITYWFDEQASGSGYRRWTLICNPVGGTLPTREVACRRLAGMTPAFFAPVPRDAVCTQIYGGPQKAVVRGVLRGQRVWTSFRRRNGCEISRWKRFSPWLILPGGATR